MQNKMESIGKKFFQCQECCWPVRHLVALLVAGLHLKLATASAMSSVAASFTNKEMLSSWKSTCFVSSDQLWYRSFIFLFLVLSQRQRISSENDQCFTPKQTAKVLLRSHGVTLFVVLQLMALFLNPNVPLAATDVL